MDHFDELAQALAQGLSRRQAIQRFAAVYRRQQSLAQCSLATAG